MFKLRHCDKHMQHNSTPWLIPANRHVSAWSNMLHRDCTVYTYELHPLTLTVLHRYFNMAEFQKLSHPPTHIPTLQHNSEHIAQQLFQQDRLMCIWSSCSNFCAVFKVKVKFTLEQAMKAQKE
jgi:hypothetical protein